MMKEILLKLPTVFIQNFKLSENTEYAEYEEVDNGPDYGIEDPQQFCCSTSLIGQRKQLVFFGFIQVALSVSIFAATLSEPSKGLNVGAVEQMSDAFTLWTNSALFINGVLDIFIGSRLEWRQRLNHQMQAALLPATLFLLAAMEMGVKYLGVTRKTEDYGIAVAAFQHVPSVFVAYLSSRFYGIQTSEVFLKPSLPFFFLRTMFAFQYLMRDGIDQYVAYLNFDYAQNGEINRKQLGFMMGCFAIDIFFANVITYGLAKGAEKLAPVVTDLFKKCREKCASPDDSEVLDDIPELIYD